MERIKKLDFTVPEGCDADAADFIRKLLVRPSLLGTIL
jgi:hypothetical protein